MNPADLALLLEQQTKTILERLEPDEVLDVQGASALLKIGRNQLLELVHAREIPCKREERKFTFSRRDLLEWFRAEARKNLTATPQQTAV